MIRFSWSSRFNLSDTRRLGEGFTRAKIWCLMFGI